MMVSQYSFPSYSVFGLHQLQREVFVSLPAKWTTTAYQQAANFLYTHWNIRLHIGLLDFTSSVKAFVVCLNCHLSMSATFESCSWQHDVWKSKSLRKELWVLFGRAFFLRLSSGSCLLGGGEKDLLMGAFLPIGLSRRLIIYFFHSEARDKMSAGLTLMY